MNRQEAKTIDGNEAVARAAYALNEVIAIYPITPASTMGEWADAWAAAGEKNIWGTVPSVIEMQSEGGAAGAIHGALQTGALATTFTASQGLLLMIPNMFKIAGELTPAVLHVAARSLAAQALSIFGDHSDVMAARSTGWAMLSSANVQEAQDLALIAQAATLESRLPFVHFFDGFRTSHEISKIELLSEAVLRAMIDEVHIDEHRQRALSPEHPVIRGTAQNPDVYFQARETVNPFYTACPDIVQGAMDRFAGLTGRQYRLYEYHGAPDAERVVVLMGSGCETVAETAVFLNARGEKVGVLNVRLFRPFDGARLVAALPVSAKAIAVLDRCKEPGSVGEPLYLEVITALKEAARNAQVVGGRYGLASKEFTPAMVKAVFDNLAQLQAKNHFTVGIRDDVSHTSLAYDESFSIESDDTFRALFFGLGSDGTVGANKETIKIIGENTDHYAQGYFVYDSKKAGAVTVSHLRFGPRPVRAPYLISQAHFIGCHQPLFLERFDVTEKLLPGGVLLLNSPVGLDAVWSTLPEETQRNLIAKRARLFVIDAGRVARECGMGGRINTVMQTCFFSVSGVLPRENALAAIKDSIRKTYGKKGEEIVQMNLAAVDNTLEHLHEVRMPSEPGGSREEAGFSIAARHSQSLLTLAATEFERSVLGELIAGRGDRLPVSALPCDGTFPTSTARWEKRRLAMEIPVWDPDVCIQCGKCVFVCPHAVIRSKVYEPGLLAGAPAMFKSHDARHPEWKGSSYTLQVAPEDCTGCGICVDVCPARNKSEARLKAINMRPQAPLCEAERKNWEFFLSLPDLDRRTLTAASVRAMQALEPLFEFSGACAGCGETPYLKLLSQLFGDRLLVANATGCSSIYGGNLPTTPWAANKAGRGPAWANSLFEDNAEFGLGYRVSLDKQREFATELLQRLSSHVGEALARRILENKSRDEADIHEQREAVAELKKNLIAIIAQRDSFGAAQIAVEELGAPASLPASSSKSFAGEDAGAPRFMESGQPASASIQTRDPFPFSKRENESQFDSTARAARRLMAVADALVKKSVWIIGGDGWAYDIGFGGLDHVLASGRNVKVLVLDTEVYSNTGGQCSKATPRGAVAKFAAGGKPGGKKDLGLMAMTYGNVYVASVAMGAKDEHTLKAFLEAEAYDGPALIIAYSHCIAHGINMTTAMQNQKAVVNSGQWLLYRYNPERAVRGENPVQLDSQAPRTKVQEYLSRENRFKMLTKSKPEEARKYFEQAQHDVDMRWRLFQFLASCSQAPKSGSVDGGKTDVPEQRAGSNDAIQARDKVEGQK
jgi:pyruvate-ferredoxin/flavodoxin oxidoreductase